MAFALIESAALMAKEIMIKQINAVLKYSSIILLLCVLASCDKKEVKTYENELHKLQKEAYDFNFRFVEIRNNSKSHLELFSNWKFENIVENKSNSDSVLSSKPFTVIDKEGIVYKREASSINAKLDTFLQRVFEEENWLEQVYIGFQNSGIMIYPEMDYLVGSNDFELLSVTKGIEDAFYVDFHENGIWYTKPHHDPFGNAWVVSWRYILNGYNNSKAWLGLDFDLQRIFTLNKFEGNRYLLVHKSGLLLAAQPKALISLALPALYKSEYIKNITYKKEPENIYTVHYSASSEVRKSFLEILNGNKKIAKVKVGSHNYTLLVASISELDAFLIRVVD